MLTIYKSYDSNEPFRESHLTRVIQSQNGLAQISFSLDG